MVQHQVADLRAAGSLPAIRFFLVDGGEEADADRHGYDESKSDCCEGFS